MRKPSHKKLLLVGTVLIIALALLVAGGLVISSAQAASVNSLDKKTVNSGCDPGVDAKCKGDRQSGPGDMTKGLFTIVSVKGDQIQATYSELQDKKGKTVAIITTASTDYKPDKSIVAAGKAVFVLGTINTDSSITAQQVVFNDPTIGDYSGQIISINGLTIIVHTKDLTHTIHVTAWTSYLNITKSKQKEPASQSDLKVGTIIQAQGKLQSDGSLTADSVVVAAQ